MWFIFLFLQVYVYLNVSWSQTVNTCEIGVLHPHLYITGIPSAGVPITVGHKLRFLCGADYQLDGSMEIECLQNGQWNPSFPTCSVKTCEIGVLHPHLYITGIPSAGAPITVGHKLRFLCGADYQLDGSMEIECLQNGQWNPSFPTCSGALGCSAPPSLPNGETRGKRLNYDHGEQVEYFCRDNYNLEGGSYKTCENGEWKGDMQCIRSSGCSHPPQVANGDTLSFTKPDYQEGERVEYSCFSRYTMEGGPFKTCRNGKWEGEMRCIGACTVDEQLMEQNNLRFTYSWGKKLYAVHEDHIFFSCKRGTRHVGRVPLRVQCIEGVMELPTCQ